MKKLAVGSLALLPLVAFAAPKDGVYVAATLEPFNTTVAGSDDFDNDFGLSVMVGYDYLLSESFSIGFSVEYNYLGEVNSKYSEPNYSYSETLDVDGFSATLRPKLYISDGPIYISPYFGVGKYSYELTMRESSAWTNPISMTFSDSGTIYKYGIEAGVQLENNFMLNIGWKESYFSDNDVNLDIHGIYLGAGYRF